MASQIASLWRSTQVSQGRNGPCRSLLLLEWQASERLPRSAVPRIQERRSSFLVLPLTMLESRGRGRVEGERSPCPALRAVRVIVPRWGLSTPVSFRYALRGLHPHSWDAWRPRVHLLHPDSITCQIPSVSPRAETLSTHLLPLHTCFAPVQILKLGRVELCSVRAKGGPPANASSVVRAKSP